MIRFNFWLQRLWLQMVKNYRTFHILFKLKEDPKLNLTVQKMTRKSKIEDQGEVRGFIFRGLLMRCYLRYSLLTIGPIVYNICDMSHITYHMCWIK